MGQMHKELTSWKEAIRLVKDIYSLGFDFDFSAMQARIEIVSRLLTAQIGSMKQKVE